MTDPEILDHIATLQRWLAAAWRRLGDPALTLFDRRELRNQMKQADASLRQCLALASELKSARKTRGGVDRSRFENLIFGSLPEIPSLKFVRREAGISASRRPF